MPGFAAAEQHIGQVARHHSRNRHVEYVRAQRQQSAILKNQGLRRQYRRHHDGCRRRPQRE